MHMTYFEKSIENFLEQLEFDSDFYGVLTNSELLELAKDFLWSYDEWADSQVDIYNSDLWEKAPKFQLWNEDALNEFWFDKSRGMIGIFQMWQYLFYSRLAGHILNNLSDYASA